MAYTILQKNLLFKQYIKKDLYTFIKPQYIEIY